MIIKIDHHINVREGRMGVMQSQRIGDLHHLENYLGGGRSLSVLDSWQNYEIDIINSIDKVQDMTT